MTMIRYMLFDAPTYYPSGGVFDCVGIFDTLQEAEASEVFRKALASGLSDVHILEVPSLHVFTYPCKGIRDSAKIEDVMGGV